MKVLNELLGYWVCPEGARAEVYQTKKQGRHFYTRCDCCGLNQGTGKTRQQSIFDTAEFLNRDAVVIPSGVVVGAVVNDSEQPKTPANESEQQKTDFDPQQMKAEQAQSVQPEKSGGAFKAILPLAILGLAIGAGAWMN